MQSYIVTITHGNEGIRLKWPDSTVVVFANPIHLAEAYASSKGQRESARKTLTTNAAAALNALEKLIIAELGTSSPLVEAAAKLRSELAAAAEYLL